MRLVTLLDSGSPISFIKEKFVASEIVQVKDDNLIYRGINGSPVNVVGTATVNFSLGGSKKKLKLLVVTNDTMKSPVILGRDAFREFGLKLACQEDQETENAVREILNIEIEETKNEKTEILNINPEVAEKTQECLVNLFVEDYVRPNRPKNPKVEAELKITLKSEHPFHFSPRRLSYAEKEGLGKILDDLLKRAIIRPSESEYASPIVLVKKKSGETRLCVDFRELNKLIVKDNYPLPLIEDHLDVLNKKKFFSSLDLKDGFYHVKVADDSIKYTSFVTPNGQFEYLRMPFGLKTAPSRFQRLVNTVLKELIASGDVVVYMDDILVATETLEHHMIVLKRLFGLMVANKLELRMDKCKFLFTEVQYLGYKISERGISPTAQGIEAVTNFPIPKNVKDVQSFLGLSSYFRKFVEGFSTVAKPLYDLLKKDSEFRFSEIELIAFETLKERLVEAPILAIFDPRDETELHCDASALGFGAILMQRKEDLKFHPIFYFSKRTSDAESRYHSFELEMLAIIYALKRFRIYLHGQTFKIVTDCNSLALALKKHEINPRIARWVLELQNYDYSTEHREGKRMTHVDGLSRISSVYVVEDNSFESNLVLAQLQDEQIVGIRDKLEKSEDKFFEMRNGVVYRKAGENLLFYVPSSMERSITFKYHDELGHIGTEKTCDTVSKNYWFPGMRKKILEHIRNCCKCIAFTPSSGKVEGLVHSIPKGDKPFYTLHIDHIGILDARVTSKKHILVVVDAFTKFTKLYPTKSTTSAEAIAYLKQYFISYSKPKVLISDRGTCFTSKEFTDFLSDFEVQHVKVATGSPQANGQVERVNRTLAPMIGKLCDNDIGNHWPKVVTDVEYALNNSVHKSTGETPSQLLFGIDQRGKINDNVKDFVNNNDRNLESIRHKAKEQIERTQQYNKSYTDKKRKRAHEYQVGDYIMIRNFDPTPGISPKLTPSFKGPYEVKKILRNDRYVIADIDGFQKTQRKYQGVWEPANMRPWRRTNSPSRPNF